jgi:MFS family permease
VAPTLAVLVAGRVVQAAGAALIVPASLGLLLPAFPRRQHTLVVGIWAGVAAVAASAGPPVGGLLIELSWRWIFLINLPIGILALIGGLRFLPEVRAERGARLPDPLSAAALLAAVTLLVLGTIQGPGWGWASPATLGTLAAGAIAAALITVLFLQDQWDYSPLRAGLAIAPGPVAAAVFAISSGRIAGRFGRTVPALAGTLAIAGAAFFWLFATPARPSYLAFFLPGMILAGVGSGLTQAPLFAAAGTLPPHRATTGSAVLTMARQIGSAIGVALLVALLATSHPHSLAVFHRGWILQAAAALAAAAAIVIMRPRARARASLR